MKDVYGLHLMMRVANVRDRAALGDGATIDKFLVDLVGELGMRLRLPYLRLTLLRTKTGSGLMKSARGVERFR